VSVGEGIPPADPPETDADFGRPRPLAGATVGCFVTTVVVGFLVLTGAETWAVVVLLEDVLAEVEVEVAFEVAFVLVLACLAAFSAFSAATLSALSAFSLASFSA
jgi:hypothetical protein